MSILGRTPHPEFRHTLSAKSRTGLALFDTGAGY